MARVGRPFSRILRPPSVYWRYFYLIKSNMDVNRGRIGECEMAVHCVHHTLMVVLPGDDGGNPFASPLSWVVLVSKSYRVSQSCRAFIYIFTPGHRVQQIWIHTNRCCCFCRPLLHAWTLITRNGRTREPFVNSDNFRPARLLFPKSHTEAGTPELSWKASKCNYLPLQCSAHFWGSRSLCSRNIILQW